MFSFYLKYFIFYSFFFSFFLFLRLCAFSFSLVYPAWLYFFQLNLITYTWLITNILFYNLQSEVFAVAFALLAAGAVILTLNVLLLVILPPSPSLSLALTSDLGIRLSASFLLGIKKNLNLVYDLDMKARVLSFCKNLLKRKEKE